MDNPCKTHMLKPLKPMNPGVTWLDVRDLRARGFGEASVPYMAMLRFGQIARRPLRVYSYRVYRLYRPGYLYDRLGLSVTSYFCSMAHAALQVERVSGAQKTPVETSPPAAPWH